MTIITPVTHDIVSNNIHLSNRMITITHNSLYSFNDTWSTTNMNYDSRLHIYKAFLSLYLNYC